jgi:hypothetical protein
MTLPNPKELEALLKVLRKHGVLQLQSTDLNLVLSETPPQPLRVKSLAEETMEDQELSPEQEIERLIAWNDKLPSTES